MCIDKDCIETESILHTVLRELPKNSQHLASNLLKRLTWDKENEVVFK